MPDFFSQIPPFPFPLSAGQLSGAVCALGILVLLLLFLLLRCSGRIRRVNRACRDLASRQGVIEAAQARFAMQEVYERHGRPGAAPAAKLPPKPSKT